jgi:hypothetical protein
MRKMQNIPLELVDEKMKVPPENRENSGEPESVHVCSGKLLKPSGGCKTLPKILVNCILYGSKLDILGVSSIVKTGLFTPLRRALKRVKRCRNDLVICKIV